MEEKREERRGDFLAGRGLSAVSQVSTTHRKKRFVFSFSLFSPLFLSILSSFLLILSHPPYNLWFLAWVGLVPLLAALEGQGFWSGFRRGYLFGIVYCFGMFWWLIHVTLPGMILFNMFLALYFALFAATAALVERHKIAVRALMIACAWVTWEFARSRLFSGFGWASLGHTQYRNIPLIQWASVAGVFGVSFILMIVNGLIAGAIAQRDGARWKSLAAAAVIATGVCLAGWGFLADGRDGSAPLRAAVIQPNIAQSEKWDPLKREEIFDRLGIMTRRAAEHHPDLVIWPESSLPASPAEIPRMMVQACALARRAGVPILIGYVRQDKGRYYNSAGLIAADGTWRGEYDKRHLVPFGEYIPLRGLFPFLEHIVPVEDMSPGHGLPVFHLRTADGRPYDFSTLICFEDTVSSAGRALTRAGARVLVNMTNDAWFGKTKAPWLHLQAAVLNAAALHRPVIRSSNTGVSAAISASGEIQGVLTGEDGQAVFQSGVKIFTVHPASGETFYLKFGDIFAYLCIACLFLNVIMNHAKFFIQRRRL